MMFRYIAFFLLTINFATFAESIRVVTEDLPPLQIQQTDNSLSGAMVELITLILSEAELEGQIAIYPWARSYEIALTEPNTLIFSMLRSPSREQKFQWIGKIYQIDSFFMALKSRHDIQVSNKAELHQYAIGSIRHDLAEQYLLDNHFDPEKNLYLNKKYDALWHQLFQGRTDLVFTNSIIWRHEVESSGLDPEQLTTVYKVNDFSSDLYLAANVNTSPVVIKRLKAALENIKSDGRYQQIIDKWQL
ncbi:substrate-binding periplasmic protein [Colwellia sp. MEBiC06753]